jgi:heme/copper-type cytochrome/quinol oxidase subunit 4
MAIPLFNRDLWDRYNPTAQCVGSAEEAHLFWAHAIIGVVTDLALLIIPIYLVYTRMLASAKSIRVIMIFGVGELQLYQAQIDCLTFSRYICHYRGDC